MRGPSRASSPVICRGVAVTAARRAGEKNRPAGAWCTSRSRPGRRKRLARQQRNHPMARRPLNHRKLC
jgi:hypothetical protein